MSPPHRQRNSCFIIPYKSQHMQIIYDKLTTDLQQFRQAELLHIQPLKISWRWAGYLPALFFHTVSPVYAQTCLDCFKHPAIKTASRWTGCLLPRRIHTVSAVNAQTCLNGYTGTTAALERFAPELCRSYFSFPDNPLAMEILLTSAVPSVTNILSASPGFS